MAGGDDKLQLVIDLAQAEIAVQMAASVGVDSLSIGILLFDSALAGTIIASASIHLALLDDSWGYPLVGLVLSAVLAFTAAGIGGIRAGPKVAGFHDRIQRLDVADAQATAVEALLETIKVNRGVVQRKEGVLGLAFLVLALTVAGYGLYLVKDILGRVVSGPVHPLFVFVSSYGSQLAGLLILGCLLILMVWIYAREG